MYGYPGSACTRRVKTVAYEKGIPFELVSMHWASPEVKTPQFLEKQPFGQIPYLDDDGFLIYESRAICRYLANKYADQGPKLVPEPTDLKEMALFEQAASVELSNHDTYAFGITEQKIFSPMFGREPDEKRVQQLLGTLKSKLEGYERILSKQKYLYGNELSIVDLFHLPYGSWVDKLFPEVYEKNPHVARWWNSLKERESWKLVEEETAAALAAEQAEKK